MCNNQLLDWIKNELTWILSFVPGLASVLPNLVVKLHAVKEKYMTPATPLPTNDLAKKWDFSFAAVWNTIVWLMLLNFFFKIVNSTAQSYMKKQLDSKQPANTTNNVSSPTHSD